MELFISPIRAVLDQLDDKNVNYILCTSSERLNIEPKENVLVLQFMDITDGTRQDAFQKEQAEAVCRFLQCSDSGKDLFICCDSGTSRSAAIAAAIILSQNKSDLYIWRDPEYHPNHYVFKLQCAAFGIDICDDEILMRKRLNEDSFSRTAWNDSKGQLSTLRQFRSRKRSKDGKGYVIRKSVQRIEGFV